MQIMLEVGLWIPPEKLQWACESVRHERSVGTGQGTRAELQDGLEVDGACGRCE